MSTPCYAVRDAFRGGQRELTAARQGYPAIRATGSLPDGGGDVTEVTKMKISTCPDKTTCQNEAMIEELQEQLAAANARIAELEAQVTAVPVEAIQEAQRFCATAFHPTANLDVMLGEWWKPFVSWVDAQAQAQP